MLQLFNYPNTRGLRVTWMLEELGADYEFKLVPFGANRFASEDYLNINPAGKVPALRDGDMTLTESAAIVTYLGDRFPDKKLVSACGDGRARTVRPVVLFRAHGAGATAMDQGKTYIHTAFRQTCAGGD